MRKEIKRLYCPICERTMKFENNPSHVGCGGVVWRIILASLFAFIPLIGWLLSLICIISIFYDTNDDDTFYCCQCGYETKGGK